MPPDMLAPRRRRSRMALAVALVAAGCSGSGSGCGSSCGGAFKTTDAQGRPFRFTGPRLDNAAQLRVTRSGLDFLDATHLNDLLAALNASGTGLAIPCFDAGTVLSCSQTLGLTQITAVAGDSNFNGQCDAGDATPLSIEFKNVAWSLDAPNRVLRATISAHIRSGDFYLRTKEAHSTLCGTNSPIQAHVWIDDEGPGVLRKDTLIDLQLRFGTAPDGRLELDVTDDSLRNILSRFDPGAISIDGAAGANPKPPPTGTYTGNGCDQTAANLMYSTMDSPVSLTCAGVFDVLGCAFSDSNRSGFCQFIQQVKEYLLQYLQTRFKDRLVALVRKQLDLRRCQLGIAADGSGGACDAAHPCPPDDDGHVLGCATGAEGLTPGVCFAPSQAAPRCEPVSLSIAGQLDLGGLTDKVGFPPGTRLDLFAGLGSKTALPQVDTSGVQLSAMAGTAPASALVSVCVPPASAPAPPPPPALDFDDPAIRPATGYDVGFALSSAVLNRGFLDAYAAGLLCATLSSKTTSRISTALFSTFLPSLRLVTGGKDVPMMILVRPQTPPTVRIGQNSASDPLITLRFRKLHLDFYAPVDERMVRIFTLEADVTVPLSLRVFPGNAGDTLIPVLGDLQSILTNVKASDNAVLAEDPGVVASLLPAVVQVAQPLLAGVLKPIQLPKLLTLDILVRQLAGAVPMANVEVDGYSHLAVHAQVAECAGTCAQPRVRTEARIVSRWLPDEVQSLRAPGQVRPQVEIEAGAQASRGGRAELSYRVDGGLWSPWLAGPRFTVRDAILLFPGHHRIDVIAREAGDDHTADPEPVALDFFVSYEAPAVELRQRADGDVVTVARSAASHPDELRYSYRLDAGPWTQPGPARRFDASELSGRTLSVSVTDEAGRTSLARYSSDPSLPLGAAGCSTSSHMPSAGLLGFGLLAILLARKQKPPRPPRPLR